MPTPVQAFATVAAKHGDIDPSDLQAVRRFYEETLPTLEPTEFFTILEELLAYEGRAGEVGPEPVYPRASALPTLLGSPPPLLPLLACGWGAMLCRLLRRER